MEDPPTRRATNERDAPYTFISARWFLLLLLFFGLAVNYIHRGNLSLAAPLLMKELGLSTAAMGILLSAFFWSYSLMQIPMGWLSDRLGVKHVYGVSYALWCLVCAGTAFAHNFALQLLMRVLLGVGQAAIFPASTRAVAAWFSPSERGTATGLYLTGSRFGMVLVAPLGALILTVFGWRMLFLLTGLPALLWLVPWLWLTGGPGEKMAQTAAIKSVGSAAVGNSNSAAANGRSLSPLDLLRYRPVWGAALGFFCYDYAWLLYVTWLPGYLMLERGFSLQQTGFYGSLPLVSMSVMIPLAGVFSDRLVARGHDEVRVRKFFLATGLIIGCLIVPAGLVKGPYSAVCLLTLSLTGLGIASPNTWTLPTAIVPKNSVGTVAGIQNFAGNIGGILAPALTGFIAHATGSFAIALGLAGGVLILGAMAYIFLVPGKISLENRQYPSEALG